MLEKKWLISVCLLLILFVFGCSVSQEVSESHTFERNVSLEQKIVVQTAGNQSFGTPVASVLHTEKSAEKEMAICPTATATNCRVVEGVTKSEKKGLLNKVRDVFDSKSECKKKGTVTLASPMHIEDVGLITPMGAMVGGHVTPIDHMYFQPIVFQSPPDTYEVYADADGIITEIAVEPAFAENKHRKIRMIIRHTCDFYSIYNLLTSLSPELAAVTGKMTEGNSWSGKIKVRKGQLLGKIGGQTLDLSVNYDEVILKGFIVPEHYAGEEWKIHTVDPFDYFEEPGRSALLAKNPRTALPRGGKIDYDVDGKLVGSWFVFGSGGFPAKYVPEVWKSHLSFVYDPLDPTHIVISMGDYDGKPMQFAVRGNTPDPKDVAVGDGVVKYELVHSNYVLENGKFWDRMSAVKSVRVQENEVVNGVVEGTVLVQMLTDRMIRFEAFPLKKKEEVAGFTAKAKVYER